MPKPKKLPIVILISGNGSNLQAIIDAANNYLPVEIAAVISSNSSAYGLERAKSAKLNSLVVDSKHFTDRNTYDQALINAIQPYSPQLIILAGFMRILGPIFLNEFHNKILNIHPSLLPKYPGLNTHKLAIEAGDSEHGCSIHFVTDKLDLGPLIAQAVIKLTPEEPLEQIKERVHKAEHFLYPTVINWFCQNRVTLRDNNVLLDNIPLPKSGLRFFLKSL